MVMNQQEIQNKLNKNSSVVRTGGKGTMRRKKKVLHKTAATDDKKLQNSLKKLGVNNIPGIEEVNMFKDDGSVLHFINPKVQASLTANTFAVTGQPETKQIGEMLPTILSQLGTESLSALANLKNLTGNLATDETKPTGDAADADDDDDVPELVQDFEEVSKEEDV